MNPITKPSVANNCLLALTLLWLGFLAWERADVVGISGMLALLICCLLATRRMLMITCLIFCGFITLNWLATASWWVQLITIISLFIGLFFFSWIEIIKAYTKSTDMST